MRTAPLRFPDLVWSHFSRPRFGGFDERVAAAASSGMKAIGLYLPEYERLLNEEHRTPESIKRLLESHEIVISDLEVARDWWARSGPDFDAARQQERVAFDIADTIGARYLQAIGPYGCSLDQAIEGFASLCDRAAEHDLLVGIEWLPFTNITNAEQAAAIVNGADRPNGGYCVDIWHHVRGANDMSMIRSLDPDRVFAVQLNDGTTKPALGDYKDDCLANRLVPGDGDFDVAGFVRLLVDMGVSAPLSLEICSTELWAAPASEAAEAAASAMRRVLNTAGVLQQ